MVIDYNSLVWGIIIGFLFGIVLAWIVEGSYINKLHHKYVELEHRCEMYKQNYRNMREMLSYLRKEDVELLQKENSIWIVMKDVDFSMRDDYDGGLY